MRRIAAATIALVLGGTARAGAPLYVSADVPTTELASLNTLLESQVFRYDVPPSYSLVLVVPGNPTLDGIHRMDRAGTWLLSVESASTLAGGLGGAMAQAQDVIRFDENAGTMSFFFCGASLGIPRAVNVDALALRGGDRGDLLLSFDVPVTLGAFTFEPADLALFQPAGSGCGDWTLATANPDFDASTAGNGISPAVNLIGAEQIGSLRLLSFDVPVDLGPPGVTTYVPGQIVSWDGTSFGLFEALAGWPIRSGVDGLAWTGNPGRVPPTIRLGKTTQPQLDTTPVEVSWTASCSSGASYYAIYEGTLGSWYSHTANDCSDDFVPFTETVTPGAGRRYFLVVPHNVLAEGSYGSSRNYPSGSNTERPTGSGVCAAPRVLGPCP